MQHLQTSFFYDLQELIRNSPLLRKYYYLFKALELSALPDRNYGVGATGATRYTVGFYHKAPARNKNQNVIHRQL